MIWYVVTREYFHTVIEYFGTYGGTFSARPRIVFYDQLARARRLPSGTYIFSDIERLTPAAAERAAQVWRDLSAAGEHVRLLNHPTRSLRRYELLRALYEDGVNAFNVYRLTDQSTPERFPVFLRREEHGGYISPLLADPAALAAEAADLDRRGQSREDKLIVEFCDTADAEGLYRKYSAFVVGAQVIPAHIFFARHWLAKQVSADKHSSAMLEEERCYIHENPHADALITYARRACIEYGRIDYSVVQGSLQIWEINTNPQLPVPLHRHAVVPQQVPQLHLSVQKLSAALAALERQTKGAQITVSPEKTDLIVWAKRGVGVLPRRYQPVAKRLMRRWYRTGSVRLRRT